ncbi:conserved protein of unknown function [Ruminococcaceae bacterium BL-4]|nr:conserved protein of unknown function [Ruminococcaceae bacterium BL-4]
MKWLKNLENISQTGTPGSCPCCGSNDTQYAYTEVDAKQHLGYGDVWCNSCKNAFHISRLKIPNDYKAIHNPPKGLKY